MKKRRIFIAILITVFGMLASCKKSFLDKNPHDSIPLSEAIQTETDMDAAVNGLYASLRWSNLYGENIPMIGDVYADNVYISSLNSGRYLEFNNYTVINSDSYVDAIWSSAYNSILLANQVINAALPADANVNQLRGEALTLRALLYFELVRWYAKPYSSANVTAEGVPIVLTYNIFAKPVRSSIGAVYTQALADLDSAINLLNVQKNSEYISVWSAKGLRSKVYQYMANWANAETDALDVINNSGYTLADSANYIQYWNNPGPSMQSETLFEVSIDGTNNNGTNALSGMYSQSGYGDALCDSGFYNTFSPADVRSQLFIVDTRGGDPAIIVNKYSNYLNTSDQDDAKVLRLSEVYLILAEAYHNLGDDADARTYVNIIATTRQPGFAGYTASGDSLLTNITNERRKELAFEGNRYLDLTRLGKDIVRSTQFPITALNIPASDYRRIFPIPLVELNANPKITQNAGY